MKKRKSVMKILSTVFSAILLISSISHPVFAQDKTPEMKPTSINEYQMLKQLNQEYHKEKLKGTFEKSRFYEMTQEDITSIENYKELYIEKIMELKSWSIEQLKVFNYSDSQIQAIKSFDGSEEMLNRAASVCVVSGDFDYFTPSANGTKAKFVLYFTWQGIQSNGLTDYFAVTWSAPFNVSSETGYVQYKNANNNYVGMNVTPRVGSVYGSFIEFKKYYSKPGDGTPYYVSGGSIVSTLTSNDNIKDITAIAQYGYNSWSVLPSVSFPGALSINFSLGINIADEVRIWR